MQNKFFFRLTTVLPADKSNATPTTENPNRLRYHRRPGLGQSTKDWTIELMCVCVFFKVFLSLFFFFFWPRAVGFPSLSSIYLRALFSFAWFLFAPWRFFWNSWVEEYNAFWPSYSHYTALRLLRFSPPTLYTLHIPIIYVLAREGILDFSTSTCVHYDCETVPNTIQTTTWNVSYFKISFFAISLNVRDIIFNTI